MISGPGYARLLTQATGVMLLAVFGMALAGVRLWGTHFVLWAYLVIILWVGFVGLPLWLLSLYLGERRD